MAYTFIGPDGKEYDADRRPVMLNIHSTWAGLGGAFSRIDHKGGSAYHCGCAECSPVCRPEKPPQRITCEADAKVAGYTRLVYAESEMYDGVYLVKPDADLDGVVRAWCDDTQKLVRLNGWVWTFNDA